MGPICLQEQTYCTCLNLTLSPLDHAFPQWHKAQGLSHLSSSVQMFPFPRTMFVLRAVFSHLTNLSLLEGHHLFGSGSIVRRELVGCFFIQYKCPPGIVKYLEIICWYSIPPPLKELADYIFPSYTFFFFLLSLDRETRSIGPGCGKTAAKKQQYTLEEVMFVFPRFNYLKFLFGKLT